MAKLFNQIAICGVGLIGGSLALIAREKQMIAGIPDSLAPQSPVSAAPEPLDLSADGVLLIPSPPPLPSARSGSGSAPGY